MKKFPKRTKQHVSESDSFTILNNQLPADWFARPIGERDYGIDLILEKEVKGQMMGDMIVAQVKGFLYISKREYDIQKT